VSGNYSITKYSLLKIQIWCPSILHKLELAKSICSEVVKLTKTLKSKDFAKNLVSSELSTSTMNLQIIKGGRLMRWGQNHSSLLILHLFILFSRGRTLIVSRFAVVALPLVVVFHFCRLSKKLVPVDLEPDEVHSQPIFHFWG